MSEVRHDEVYKGWWLRVWVNGDTIAYQVNTPDGSPLDGYVTYMKKHGSESHQIGKMIREGQRVMRDAADYET